MATASDNTFTEKDSQMSPTSTASGEKNESQQSQNVNQHTPNSNTPITTLTVGGMMKIFTASLYQNDAQAAIQKATGVMIQEQISPIKEKVGHMEVEIKSITQRINTLEKGPKQPPAWGPPSTPITQIDYTRRNNIVLSGVKGTTEEGRTKLKAILKKLALPISNFSIFKRGKNETLVVEFATHRDKLMVYKERTKLANNGFKGIFLNEDLNNEQARVFYLARTAKKQGLIHSTWTMDGVTNISKIVRGETQTKTIASEEELKTVLPGLTIDEPSTKSKKKTIAKEWSDDAHEAQAAPNTEPDDQNSSDGELTDSEEEEAPSQKKEKKSRYKVQPVEPIATRAKTGASKNTDGEDQVASTSTQQPPNGKRPGRKAKEKQ